MDLFSMIGSVMSGGITGLLGTGLTKWAEFAELKEKNAHEIELKKADAAIMAQEWAARTQVAQVEADQAKSVSADTAFAEAVKAESIRYSQGVTASPAQAWLLFLLDFLRGIVRPGLTIYLCAVTTAIWITAHRLAGAGILPAQAVELLTRIVDTVLYLTTTCVLFWFGTRANPKK